LPICAYLINAGAKKDQQDLDGHTPLIISVQNRRTEVCQFLVDEGVDKDLQDIVGNTALLLASCMGQVEMCRCLLEAGADLFLQNLDGWTALVGAKKCNHKDIAALLEAHTEVSRNVPNSLLRVSVPTHIDDAKRNTYYIVKVEVPGLKSWELRRTYEDFEQLYTVLKARFQHKAIRDFQFPRSTQFGFVNAEKVKKQRQQSFHDLSNILVKI